MAAVIGIMRGHHGGVQVYSEPQTGSVFRLLFPTSSTAELAAPPLAPKLSVVDFVGKVLIIDDEPSVGEAVVDMLSIEGISACFAEGGVAGVDHYRANIDDIDLVLLDLSMPDMSGEQVFQQLRRINPAANIILSSGYSQHEATRHFIGRGLADFLQKPYDYQTLMSKVRSHL